MDRVYFRAIGLLALLLILACPSHASVKKKVNLLSWWGYLSVEGVKSIEKECNVEVSVDEYYSSSEFLRRWDEKPNAHDLVIYSNTIYNAVKGKLNVNNSHGLLTTPYHPLVADKVKDLGFRKNTRLLSLAFTGFMWNKKNISIHESSSLESMLTQSKGKIVVILDDAIEGLQILDNLKYFQKSANKEKKANVVITNDIENLVRQADYGFSYHWSGGAISAMSNIEGDFGFMVHSKLSHVTGDLISVMNSKPESKCVFNYIAGVEFLQKLQRDFFYFSPYGGVGKEDNKYLIDLYNNYFLNLQKYRWLHQPAKQDFKTIDDRWKKLKIQLSN